jgi:hypothetical protein
MPEVAGPHYGSPDKQVLFKAYERVGNKKPSYSPQEDPKSINTIKPEEIANAIFRLLKIDFVTPFETIFTGKKYTNQPIREVVPNDLATLNNPEIPVEIRADLHYDEKILGPLLAYYQKSVVVTDKPLNLEFLKKFKPHIPMVVFKVKEDSDFGFIKEIIDAGFQLIMVSALTEEQLEPRKIYFYEFGAINKIEQPKPEVIAELRKDIDRLYYQSCKMLAADGALYRSTASRTADIKSDNDFEYQKVIDTPEFWQDLEFYMIVRKTLTNEQA